MIKLTNDSTTITLGSWEYVLTSIDYGAVDAAHSTAKGAEQIGKRLINTTLDTRNIAIVGFIRANSPADMRAKKAALYQLCEPRKEFRLLVMDDALLLRCYTTNTVKFATSKLINNDRFARFVIDAFCPDPLFADAVARYRKIAEWVGNFIWPLEILSEGFTFADRSDSLITTLVNDGDVETGMLIYFTASASVANPVLTNVETGEFIRLNRTLAAGETVVINTHYGAESVISYTGDNVEDIINDFDLDSTFLQAPIGETSLHYTADGNITAMEVTIHYFQRYLGV